MTINPASVPVDSPAPEPVGRLGRGIVWSDLVAEMERDWAQRELEFQEDREAA